MEGAVATEGRLDLEAVDAKLVGLDKKIERIAGAVGARIGSGVSEAAIADGGGGGGKISLTRGSESPTMLGFI